jgi:hypothetical protein
MNILLDILPCTFYWKHGDFNRDVKISPLGILLETWRFQLRGEDVLCVIALVEKLKSWKGFHT